MRDFDNRKEEIAVWLKIIKNISTPGGTAMEQDEDIRLGEHLIKAEIPQKLVELLHYITTNDQLTKKTLLTIRQMLCRND